MSYQNWMAKDESIFLRMIILVLSFIFNLNIFLRRNKASQINKQNLNSDNSHMIKIVQNELKNN